MPDTTATDPRCRPQPPHKGLPAEPYDVEIVREDFPILKRLVHERPGRLGKPLVYLDNAASAQKPRAVIDAMTRCMALEYSNVHRGVHYLSQQTTDAYEAVRDKVRMLLNAGSREEIVFTRNATESFNLVAATWGRKFLGPGDEIVLSVLEHHANIVPWQLLQAERGFAIRVIPCDDRGALDLDAYAALLGPKTRLVSVTHGSNVLGTVTPAAEIVRLAHDRGIPVMIDGSQAVPHMPVDVQALGADFYAFTGHKLYGPTGIGVLYGRKALLESMPPYQGGGDMIAAVSFSGTSYREPPYRFEAGTPPIIEGIGLGAAIDYVRTLGLANVGAHEHTLLERAANRLADIDGVRLIGTAPGKAAIVSFVIDGIHPHDIGMLADQMGVALRVGRHCAEPLMERFGLEATCRASFGLYNTIAEADALVDAVQAVKEFFR
ncbi:MAG: cysteine desulfurase [Rhodospirillaceae bacterium]